MWRVISLLMASLLLWCGTLLLYLSLYDTGQSQGKAACLGALLATLGGIWLWARFFGLSPQFATRWNLLLNSSESRAQKNAAPSPPLS